MATWKYSFKFSDKIATIFFLLNTFTHAKKLHFSWPFEIEIKKNHVQHDVHSVQEKKKTDQRRQNAFERNDHDHRKEKRSFSATNKFVCENRSSITDSHYE